MASANVTRRALTLGARDDITKWCAKEYAETTIKGSFDPTVAREVALRTGMPLTNIPYTSSPFYTADVIHRGDHLLNANTDEFEVSMANQVWWLDQFVMYACQTAKVSVPSDRAATSGTWHVDSDAVKTDPRNRVKSWLDDNIAYAVCDYQTMFAGVDYPIEREFTDNGLEIVSSVDVEQANAEYTYDHHPYKFNETTTITNIAVDTATLTATNILESFEQAIRDVATDHPLGSIRRIRSTKPDRVNIGGMWLWQNTVTIEYTRANDDFLPTHPRITWGPSAAPTGTYIFPNCTQIRYPNGVPDIKLLPPGRVGNIHQIMGDTSFVVELTCDLDVEHSDLTWKRTQTGGKTDKFNWQVFADIKHNAGIIAGNQPYQTLTLSANGPSFKVRLVDFTPIENGDRHTLTATFEEYVSADQSGSTYTTRWGIAT